MERATCVACALLVMALYVHIRKRLRCRPTQRYAARVTAWVTTLMIWVHLHDLGLAAAHL